MLAAELLDDAIPKEIGYIAIARDADKIEFMDTGGWGKDVTFEEGIESALEVIHEVIRRVRRGDFFTKDGFDPRQDPILAALGGIGILEQS